MSLYGDALEMHNGARGGNDHLTGSAVHLNLYGDAGTIDGDGRGGNDTVIGGSAGDASIYGDANRLSDNACGGDDTLAGGAFAANLIYGDAGVMDGGSRGGNDTLVGADVSSFSFLFGDANTMRDNARGGDDTLISGTGADHMWGDAQFINGVAASPTAPTGTVVTGADTFVFAPGNGNDDIGDFRQSDGDRIDVSAYGFTSLVDMMITFDGANTKIAFDASNSVTLFGFTDPAALTASDFIFA